MRVEHDGLFTAVGNAYIDTGIPILIGRAAQQAYLTLRRFVWRKEDTGHLPMRQLCRSGLLAVRVSQRRLAEISGLSRKYLRAQLQMLEELHFLLRIDGSSRRQSAIYVLGYEEEYQDKEGHSRTREVYFSDLFSTMAWSTLEKEGARDWLKPHEMSFAEKSAVLDDHLEYFVSEVRNHASKAGVQDTLKRVFGEDSVTGFWGTQSPLVGSVGPNDGGHRGPGREPEQTSLDRVCATEREKEKEEKERKRERENIPLPLPRDAHNSEKKPDGSLPWGSAAQPEGVEEDQGNFPEAPTEVVRGWRRRKVSAKVYAPVKAPPKVDAPFAGSLLGDDLGDLEEAKRRGMKKAEEQLEANRKRDEERAKAPRPKKSKKPRKSAKRKTRKKEPELAFGGDLDLEKLQVVWSAGLKARGERGGQPFRSKKIQEQMKGVLEDFSVKEVATGITYMLQHWEKVSGMRRWKGATPTIRLLLYFSEEVINDALKWGKAEEAVRVRETWLDNNPHRSSAPDEIEGPYEKARELGQQLGIM